MNKFAREWNILKEKDANLAGEDIREGLTAIVSVKLGEPQFEGQTKGKLNSDIKGLVEAFINEKLGEAFEKNPAAAKRIIQKAVMTKTPPVFTAAAFHDYDMAWRTMAAIYLFAGIVMLTLFRKPTDEQMKAAGQVSFVD